MKRLIKVCGMRDPDNIRNLIDIKPDMIGLIFYPDSPRYVAEPEKLVSVLNNREGIKLVGVFVNEDIGVVMSLNSILNFDLVQLHGHESPDYCENLKSNNLNIIKAFGFSVREDLANTIQYSSCSDYFLFDTKTSAHGGSGRKFNWDVLEGYTGQTPFLLSGGIGPDDYPRLTNPRFAGIDLNSRFELSPGLKDISLLSKYFKQLKK